MDLCTRWAGAAFTTGVLMLLLGVANPAVAGLSDRAFDGMRVPVADSGTDDPSNSGTGEEQGEDEPSPGAADQPSGGGNQEAPPDGLGCPVRDRGPFPMLV